MKYIRFKLLRSRTFSPSKLIPVSIWSNAIHSFLLQEEVTATIVHNDIVRFSRDIGFHKLTSVLFNYFIHDYRYFSKLLQWTNINVACLKSRIRNNLDSTLWEAFYQKNYDILIPQDNIAALSGKRRKEVVSDTKN